jgi:SAM-dependent methyltransferase
MLLRRAFLFAPVFPVLQSQDIKPKMFGDAEAYERFMGRWSRLVAPRLVDFTGLPERGRMLDVGSGTGSLTFAIAKQVGQARIVGIDPSQEYVTYAISKNPFADRASFEVGDAQQLRYADASFDAALSLLVFNFIPDPKKAVFELRRVTRPGGRLSAAVWDYGDGMQMLRRFWDAAIHIDPGAEKLDEKRMPFCRQGELSSLWKEGGLEHIREQPVDIQMQFASFADYWDPFLLGQGPAGSHAHRLNHEKRRLYRNEVKRRLSLSAENAPFVLPARVWAVRGIVPKSF